jgi:hypothetical protein
VKRNPGQASRSIPDFANAQSGLLTVLGNFGAGEGIRAPDPYLGKFVLPLSYTRIRKRVWRRFKRIVAA